MNTHNKARGRIGRRILSALFQVPSWFAPHTALRVFFHRLRGVHVGKNVEIGYFCVIDNVHPDLVTIEDEAVIAVGALLLAHDNSYYYAQGTHVKHAPVVIKKRAFIGAHSVITPGVTVGEHAIVGCNSVVVKDVPAHSVVGGVPARILRENVNNENPEY
ncbi:MAG: acyltransferase [Planctomycetota bacterium]|jgi:acetyltransferase-like isoleucine patch superfamily enzyme